MSKIQLICIVVLTVVTGTLIYLILEKKGEPRITAILKPTILSDEYTQEERELFDLHISTSTQVFLERVGKVAVEGTSVDMNVCVPNPATIHAHRDNSITFNNISDQTITVRFKGVDHVIAPKSSQVTAPLTLRKRYLERMVITYSCIVDGYESRSGFVYVSP